MHLYFPIKVSYSIDDCLLPDTMRPNIFVQTDIDPDIWSTHHFFGEFFDFPDSLGSFLLELPVNKIEDKK